MAKTVPESKFTEWKGLDRISVTVHEMKCFWRELTKDDFGIDGEIEIVIPKEDGKGYETLGNVLKVQAKSGAKYVRYDTETSFASPVEKADLEGWNNSRYPVLYIVYHPKDDKLYAKEVRSYVKGTPAAFQSPCKVVFDKTSDEFNAKYFDQVKKHADVSEPRVSFQLKEELFSNLFPVRRLPYLYHASTTYTSIKTIRKEANAHLPPICIVEGRLFSFANLRSTNFGLRDFCDGDVERLTSKEWISSDPERKRDYIFLLNQLLGKIRHARGLMFNPDYNRTYFGRPTERSLMEWKVEWFSIRSNRKVEPRTVVKYYEYGINKFWRHLGCSLSFVQFGDSWFLRIVPKYLFTLDGVKTCEKELVGPYTTKIKAMEFNPQVLNHVLFWADFLARGREMITYELEGDTILKVERRPMRGITPFAIPDDPATYVEKPPSAQLTMFNLLSNDDCNEDDDYEGGDIDED